jgi:tetratricopeptide (TPR) repeat protein
MTESQTNITGNPQGPVYSGNIGQVGNRHVDNRGGIYQPNWQVDTFNQTTAHALIHTYVRERLTPPTAALARLVDHYTTFAQEQAEEGPVGFARLDPVRPHLLALVACCAEAEAWEAVRSLVWAVDSYLDIAGYWIDRVTLLQTGVAAARAGNDTDGEGAFLGNLGTAYYSLGQVEQAIEYHQQALVISRHIGDKRNEGSVLGNLGLAYADLGQVERAIEYYEGALAIARYIGDKRGEGNRLGNLGIIYKQQNRIEDARQVWQQALSLFEQIMSPHAATLRRWLEDLAP